MSILDNEGHDPNGLGNTAPKALPECCASTPRAELERQIMDSNVPKNEREWWAAREIERLRAALQSVVGCEAHYDRPPSGFIVPDLIMHHAKAALGCQQQAGGNDGKI